MSSGIYGGLSRANEQLRIKQTIVPLKAGVKASAGELLVVVAGYGVYPASANAATGLCVGVVVKPADNTSGADGAVSCVCEDGEKDFANNGTHPVAVTDLMKTVYASDKQTISINSSDGPPVGVLTEYNTTSTIPGAPARVRLVVA